MSFFSVLFALLIEQFKPLPRGKVVRDAATALLKWAAQNLDAGKSHHAWVVWTVSTVLPALLVWAVYAVLGHFSLILALGWNVGVLYVTLGFRQFSHYFTDIRAAIDRGDEDSARRLLSEWRQLDATELPRTELLRHVVEHALLAAHRHVFGVFFWFVLLASLGFGPAGAVLYRMAELARRFSVCQDRSADPLVNDHLATLATTLYRRLDHVPARLTAFGFAVVGNFEEAVTCWRRSAELWPDSNDGVVLAAAAGAVGVQLGGNADQSLRQQGDAVDPEETSRVARTSGVAPVAGHLRSVVGLVWRCLVFWMLLLALLSLANLVG
jgi:adenosylcobinamide-phosphate synthase